MRFQATLSFSILVYAALAILIFNDILAPLNFLMASDSSLGLPFWRFLVIVSAVLAAISSRYVAGFFRLPIFLSIWMLLSVLFVGVYADLARRIAISNFDADVYYQRSFFRSMREAPREFQFFLHAAAVKDCRPLAWSYSQMGFYELPWGVAVNVFPTERLDHCFPAY